MTEASQRGLAPSRAAQHGLDTGDEFQWVEGFVEVIVGALLQAEDAFGGGAHAGQQDDGCPVLSLTQSAQHFPTVEPGHEHVEDDQVGCVRLDPFEGLFAVMGQADVEAGAF